MLRCFGVAVLALLTLAVLGNAGSADGKAAFDAALAQAHQHAAAGRWKEARALLGSTLESHVDQAYVRERRDELRTILATCAFELAVPNRGVKGVFCGDVVSYDAKRGEIELRWERPKPAKDGEREPAFPCTDFEETPLGFLLRAPFDGPHSIELSGKEIGQDVPHLVGCAVESRYYDCALDAGRAMVIDRVEGEARKTLAMTTTMYNVTRPYKLALVVRAGDIEGSHNGKRMVFAEKREQEFGRVGFRDVLEPRRIEVRGKVDKAWIDAAVAAMRKDERASFDKTHDASAELPEWLRQE